MRHPPNYLKSLSVISTVEDLFDKGGVSSGNGSIYLRQNIIGGFYADLQTHGDIQFRLLREDFLEPLRLSIGKFLNKAKITGQQQPDAKDLGNIYFYSNCRFVSSPMLGKSVPSRPDIWRRYSIAFDAPIRTNWASSKRLIYGSLVTLWNAPNKLVFLAVVTHSDPVELNKGLLALSFTKEPPAGFEHHTYTMLECPVFYEPYRAVLEAFKQMDETNFPLSSFILGLIQAPGVPD